MIETQKTENILETVINQSPLSKEEALYTDIAPDYYSEQDRICQSCRFFNNPSGCSIVNGNISEDGFCRYHTKRDSRSMLSITQVKDIKETSDKYQIPLLSIGEWKIDKDKQISINKTDLEDIQQVELDGIKLDLFIEDNTLIGYISKDKYNLSDKNELFISYGNKELNFSDKPIRGNHNILLTLGIKN